jgi:hypothetical protein
MMINGLSGAPPPSLFPPSGVLKNEDFKVSYAKVVQCGKGIGR